jgi:hypothetical protein
MFGTVDSPSESKALLQHQHANSISTQGHKRWVVSLAACAAFLRAVNARPQRELKQVEVFYNTPQAAGSTSVDANGNLAVRPCSFL